MQTLGRTRQFPSSAARSAWAALPLSLALGCRPAQGPAPTSSNAIAPPGGVAREGGPEASSPRLVVAIVVDQLPSWALERYWASLPEDGAFRAGASRGTLFLHSLYSQATTLTAPGHATIYTGTTPSRHGVLSNQRFDWESKRELSVVDDRESAVFGSESAFAGPASLRAETVADALERATAGQSHTVALSYKDRAAVVPAGQSGDLALWFDSAQASFTTSTHYAERFPQWLRQWQERHPLSAQLYPWVPRDAAALQRLLGPDAAPGEGDWLGLGATFPHDPGRSSLPASAFRATPASTEHLLQLARACVKHFRLGADEAPDLLMISVSGTDYVGHVFGPESWEYVDNLQRVDAALGAFARELDAIDGVRFLITSDHGVAPMPERSAGAPEPPGRVALGAVQEQLERALRSRFVDLEGPLIQAFSFPFVVLSEAIAGGPERGAVLQAAREELQKLASVHTTFDVRALLARSRDPAGLSELALSVADSIAESTPGDIYVVLAERAVVDPRMPGGSGTNHGSPWPYDRTVPVLAWGSGVGHSKHDGPVEQSRVAATLAHLLGISPPNRADPRPLPTAPAEGPL